MRVGVHGRRTLRRAPGRVRQRCAGCANRRDAAALAALGVLRREALQLGLAGDVALDEVDAVVVVDGDVDDGDAAVDALGLQGALAGGMR